MSPVPGARARVKSTQVGTLLAVVAVALISINLRSGVGSIGPVLEELRQSLPMSAGTAGFLTAVPGFCFGVVGLLAVPIARRIGMTKGIVAGLVAIAVALVGRSLTGSAWPFLVLSTVALAGMAVGNVLVPAWIKRRRPDGDTLLTSLYGSGLLVGGAISAMIAAPVSDAFSGDWRPALGLWGLVAAVALGPWFVILRRDRFELHGTGESEVEPVSAPGPSSVARGRLTRSPTVLALTAMFGFQSMNAYIQMGWMAQIYRDAGVTPVLAGSLVAAISWVSLIGGLTMPTVIARTHRLARWLVAFGLTAALGNLGMLLAPASAPWLWAVLLGIGGFAFPGIIALITQRTRSPQVTARVSGFVQPLGYMLAGAGPLLAGIAHDLTGGWDLILTVLVVTSTLIGVFGLRVARPGFIDDELASPRQAAASGQ